jgi:hypothetical protein
LHKADPNAVIVPAIDISSSRIPLMTCIIKEDKKSTDKRNNFAHFHHIVAFQKLTVEPFFWFSTRFLCMGETVACHIYKQVLNSPIRQQVGHNCGLVFLPGK